MNNKKKILIIGAGILQVPAIIKAKEMGLYVVTLDADPNAPGFKLADEYILLSTIDVESAVQAALMIRPNAVMTLASDMPIKTVAKIGEACGLKTISCETAMNATHKGKMRQQLQKMNVPIPNFFIVSSFEEYIKAVRSFEEPFIVKPADNSGSRGIFLVSGQEELTTAFEYAKKNSRSGEILLEEYMTGPEVSVETLTINNVTHVIAITDKLTTGAPHFIEMGHSIPSQLPAHIQSQIIETAISAAKALGINIGPTHTEIIVTNDGPKIVELGARLGGDNITTHLVPLATGVNIVECSIRLALGENTDFISKYSKGAAIRYLKTPEGLLKSIHHLEEAKNINGVKEIVITKNIDDQINQINSSTDRIGYVIAQAASVQEAIRVCEEAASTVCIDIL